MATFRERQRLVEKLIHEQILLNNQYLKAQQEDCFLILKNELVSKKAKVKSIFQEWQRVRNGSHNDFSDVSLTRTVSGVDAMKILQRIEKIYLHLEYVVLNDAKNLSNSAKGNIRRARAELQRIRLSLYDVTGTRPQKNKF